MILDTSAVIAVVREEEGYVRLVDAIGSATRIGIGTPTLTELATVLLGRHGPAGRLIISRFLEENAIVPIFFGVDHWNVAAEAFIRYGKGRHPAALNFGDCMTYATAQVAGAPLLFVGDDFARTDVVPA